MQSSETILIKNRKTGFFLNQEICTALEDISRQEGISLEKLCRLVEQKKGKSGLDLALCLFPLLYYRRSNLKRK